MKHYGDQVMLFQTDCAVSAWHTTDNFEQVIFPLCSEYNVHRGSYDGHVLSFESTDGGEYKEFDSLDEVIADAEAGKLVPNTERESFTEQIARMRRERDAFTEYVRSVVESTGAFVAPVRDERASLRRTGATAAGSASRARLAPASPGRSHSGRATPGALTLPRRATWMCPVTWQMPPAESSDSRPRSRKSAAHAPRKQNDGSTYQGIYAVDVTVAVPILASQEESENE